VSGGVLRRRRHAPVNLISLGVIRRIVISPLIVNNFIDSSAFDPKYEPETAAANEIHRLSDAGRFLLQIAHSSQKEIEHPNTPSWVKDRAAGLNYTLDVNLTEPERAVLSDIRRLLAGNGKVENIIQDAQHVFEAQKYGHYFITTDNRILSRAVVLKDRCTVIILRPSEFLKVAQEFMAAEK